jgi:Zn finger protein HypA/HybF involved in hydrogenase expression
MDAHHGVVRVTAGEEARMKAKCANCGTDTDCDGFSGLCVACLVARARLDKEARMALKKPQPKFDHKQAAAGGDREE